MAERIYGMHHIGITAPDIEQGIAFFEAAFGAVTVFRTGPFNVDETFMQRKLGAAPHTRIRDLVFLRCGDGPSVELFEYCRRKWDGADDRPIRARTADEADWRISSSPTGRRGAPEMGGV